MEKLYTELGYPSKTRFLAEVRKRKLSIAEAKKYLNSQIEETIFHPQDVTVQGTIKLGAWTYGLIIDMQDMSRYSKQNKGYNWLFNCVEYRTRYAWSFPTKTKSPKELAGHLEKIIKQLPNYDTAFIKVVSDKGKEFMGDVTKVEQKYHVTHKWNVVAGEAGPFGRKSSKPVEAYNKTVWLMLRRFWAHREVRTKKKNYEYLSELPHLVETYNNRVHSTTGKVPAKALDELNHEDLPPIVVDLNAFVEGTKHELSIGDKVRIAKKVATFAKKTTAQTYGSKIHTVKGFNGQFVVLENNAEYLENALLKVDGVAQPEPIDKTEHRTIQKNNKTKRSLNRMNVKVGHEVEDIRDGEVILKKRMQPAAAKRQSKPVQRF